MGLAYLLTYKMGEIYCRGSSPIRCIWDMIHRVFVSWFLHLLSKIQQHVYHEPPKPWKKIEVLATKKPRLFTINKPLEVVEVFSIPDSHGSYCLRPWICHRRLTYFGRCLDVDMDVSENSGTPKSSILIGFSIINHPFWGTTIFGNTHIFHKLHQVTQSDLFWRKLSSRDPFTQRLDWWPPTLGDKKVAAWITWQ